MPFCSILPDSLEKLWALGSILGTVLYMLPELLKEVLWKVWLAFGLALDYCPAKEYIRFSLLSEFCAFLAPAFLSPNIFLLLGVVARVASPSFLPPGPSTETED